ncbi:MAG: hypothetical protein ABI831_00675 [Betaproteobacteria bacterium]
MVMTAEAAASSEHEPVNGAEAFVAPLIAAPTLSSSIVALQRFGPAVLPALMRSTTLTVVASGERSAS